MLRFLFFPKAQTPCLHRGACLPPQTARHFLKLLWIWCIATTALITLQKLSINHVRGLCLSKRRFRERDPLMPADKTGTQQNKHRMRRDWGRSARLMNNALWGSFHPECVESWQSFLFHVWDKHCKKKKGLSLKKNDELGTFRWLIVHRLKRMSAKSAQNTQ